MNGEQNLDYVGKWVIRFGKFEGTTFDEILSTQEGRDYCLWMLMKRVHRNEKVVRYLEQRLSN
jgi:hypothetical protein